MEFWSISSRRCCSALLIIASASFVARLVEASIREVDKGVVEAAQSMGCSPFQIISKVMIPESRPSLISGFTTAFITILSYGAMAGAIGGGGLAASVACWLKKFWPHIKVIGVEGIDQASMKTSIEQGRRVNLDYVDVFCDGTAVHIPGELTYPLCRELVDEFVTVTNNEVCQAIRAMWESSRVVPEPSGAMSLAGFLKQWNRGEVKPEEKSFVVISGANMDFTHLTQIARQAGIGNHETRYLRISMDSKRGQVLKYLRHIPQDTTLVDVQYGKTEGNTQHPVFGIAASDEDLNTIRTTLKKKGIEFEDISEDDDVRFRMIHYQPELCQHPLFVHIEFPERAGAFLDFMERIADLASLCYFNYTYTGERVGRALVGMEFDTAEDRETIRKRMGAFSKNIIRSIREISPEAFQRIMGSRQLTGNH